MTLLEQQVEFNRCASDPVYFINKYWVKKKYSPLLADFKLYNYQEELIDTVNTESRVLVNSSRQMGLSTTMDGCMLWKLNFTPNYHITTVNVNWSNAIGSLNKVRDSYDKLPEYMKTPSVSDSKKCLELSNGSTIEAASASAKAFCSRTYDLAFIDNASFANNSEFYGALQQAISTGGKLIVGSTLYKEGLFLDLCRSAEKGENAFKYIKLPYYLHPKHGRLWRSQQIKSVGEDAAIIECDCTHYYTKDGSIKPIIED